MLSFPSSRTGLVGILSPPTRPRPHSSLFAGRTLSVGCRHAAGGRRRIPRHLPSAALPPPSLSPPPPPPSTCYSGQALVWLHPRPPPSPCRRVRLRGGSFRTGKLLEALLTRHRGVCSNSVRWNLPKKKKLHIFFKKKSL